MNYIKSFFKTPKEEFSWISVLILYTHQKHLILDKGFVITNPKTNDILTYSIFSNFTVIDDNLYYLTKCKQLIQIDPSLVHLHIKIGKSPYSIRGEDIKSWSIYFSSPKNKIYQIIATSLNNENIRFINNPKGNKKIDLECPFFFKKQVYGENMDQIMFSKLNISFL